MLINKTTILFIVIFNSFGFSKNYFVDPQNGSAKNNGSYLKPWKTLEETINKNTFNDGDTLFLFTGFHGNKIIINEKHKTKVVIIASENSIPVIQQMIINGAGWEINGIHFNNELCVKADTVGKFDNGTFLILGKVSSRNRIVKSKFYSAINVENWNLHDWRTKVWNGIKDFGSNNILEGNELKNIAFAIEVSVPGTNALIKNNLIENFSGDGIRIGGADYCRIEKNKIINPIELDADSLIGNHEDGIQSWKAFENDEAVIGLEIIGNYIQNYSIPKRPFSGILQGISLFDGPYKNCVVQNNVVIVEHAHGISLYGAYDCLVSNNTVLPFPNTFPYKLGPPWIMIHSHKNGTPSKNNIVANNLSTAISIEEGSTLLFNNVVECTAFKFVNNYENFDFTPKANFHYHDKKIIDGGINTYSPQYDFNGVKRPIGNNVDIGAIEYNKVISSH